jgi:chromosome segregation ATPase
VSKPDEPPPAPQSIEGIDRAINELTERLSHLYGQSLELAKRARTAVRPRGDADADKEQALVEGLEAARIATADIDTEIDRLERQRDLLHDRLADLDGRRSGPVSLVDVLRVRALDRLEKAERRWHQCMERLESDPADQEKATLTQIRGRLEREIQQITDELNLLDRSERRRLKP